MVALLSAAAPSAPAHLPWASTLAGAAVGVAVVLAALAGVRAARRRAARAGSGSADQARARMERLQHEAHARQSLDSLLADVQEHTRAAASQIESRAVRLERIIAMADDRLAKLERSSARPAEPEAPPQRDHAPPATVRAPARTAVNSTPIDPLTRRVYELADRGKDSVEIATSLHETIGKVDLILSLRRV